MVKNEYNTFLTLERSLRWLRGMSVKQVNGCNKLLHALRDDIEQESTYRVRECLTLLGLTPMLTSKQIKSIMAISQDNDLAFLWFIWEAFYKTSHDCNGDTEHYSINEQLILSSIAHLDMMTTMRALDHILPTADYSKKYQDIQCAEKLNKENKRRKLRGERRQTSFTIDKDLPYNQRSEQLKEARKIRKKREPPQVSDDKAFPYLMPQLRPKLYAPMSMVASPSDRKMVFPTYETYKEKHYHIPNESSRWFSLYELSPVKREIKRCLSNALAPLFGGSRMPLKDSVCNVHRMLEFSAVRKEQELTCETMRRCIRLLHGQNEDKRRRRIIRQLEEDVECVALKLEQDARRQLTQLQQLIGGTCNVGTGCQMCAKLESSAGIMDRPERKADFAFLLDFDLILRHPIPKDIEKNTPVKVYELGSQRLMKFVTLEEDLSLRNTLGSSAHCSNAGKKQKSSFRCILTEGVIKVLNEKGKSVKQVGHSKLVFCPPTRKSSDASVDKFFSRKTMKNGVLHWDYFKIYQPPSKSKSGEQLRDTRPIIRSYCIAALNQAMRRSTGGAEQKKKNETPIAVTRDIQFDTSLKTADKSAKDLFAKAIKSKSLTADMEKNISERKKSICNMVSAERFKYLGSIDPDDTSMLIKLLKIAVDIMQHDPKYVLVTLPNAHMMPILVDWVAERYGKTYSYHQMRDLAKSMSLVYDRLNRTAVISQRVPFPNRNFVKGYKCIESYNKYNEYVCQVGKSSDEYHRRLNKMALEESRLIWLAMHGYSNLAGSITDTYFAYLPAKELDFVRHHLWDSRDFRDMASSRRKYREKI